MHACLLLQSGFSIMLCNRQRGHPLVCEDALPGVGCSQGKPG